MNLCKPANSNEGHCNVVSSFGGFEIIQENFKSSKKNQIKNRVQSILHLVSVFFMKRLLSVNELCYKVYFIWWAMAKKVEKNTAALLTTRVT